MSRNLVSNDIKKREKAKESADNALGIIIQEVSTYEI